MFLGSRGHGTCREGAVAGEVSCLPCPRKAVGMAPAEKGLLRKGDRVGHAHAKPWAWHPQRRGCCAKGFGPACPRKAVGMAPEPSIVLPTQRTPAAPGCHAHGFAWAWGGTRPLAGKLFLRRSLESVPEGCGGTFSTCRKRRRIGTLKTCRHNLLGQTLTGLASGARLIRTSGKIHVCLEKGPPAQRNSS